MDCPMPSTAKVRAIGAPVGVRARRTTPTAMIAERAARPVAEDDAGQPGPLEPLRAGGVTEALAHDAVGRVGIGRVGAAVGVHLPTGRTLCVKCHDRQQHGQKRGNQATHACLLELD